MVEAHATLHRIGLAAVLILYLAIAASYNLNVPVFEAPDEIWHYLYVRNLAEGRGLPRDPGRSTGPFAQEEAAQPPLYYAVAALLTFWAPRGDLSVIVRPNVSGSRGDPRTDGNKNMYLHGAIDRFPWRGEILTIHLVRFTTTMWGALTVVLTYLTGRTLFRSPWLALAAAAVVAFTPEFLFMSSAVNNDIAVAGACSLLLYLASRVATRPASLWLVLALGMAAGAVVLAKPIAVVTLALVPVAIILSAHRYKEQIRSVLFRVGIAAVVTVVTTGWWFGYNLAIYGSVMPVQSFLSRDELFAEMPSLSSFVSDLPGLWLSYWAMFGWFSIAVPSAYYEYFDVLTVVALVGLVVSLVRRWFGRGVSTRPDLFRLTLLVGLVVTVLLGVFAYRLVVQAFHGRLLLGAVSAMGLLLALGWSSLGNGRWVEYLSVLLAVSLAVPAAIFPWTVLRPAYRVPPLAIVTSVHPSKPLNATFGNDIRLIGVDEKSGDSVRARPGDLVSTTLYLQSLQTPHVDYMLFLKVVDPSGRVIADLNTHPGHGAYPTSEWTPGPVLVDRYSIHLPSSIEGPSVDRIYLGFYRQNTMENLPVTASDGSSIGSSIQVGTVVIDGPVDSDLAKSGDAFREGDREVISLVDHRMDGSPAHPGSILTGTITFGGVERLSRDYTVFVHLERDGRLIAQDDAPPRGGSYPTSYWIAGDIVEHGWKVVVPNDAVAGDYVLRVGLYDPVDGHRLNTPHGDSVDLGIVRVQ